MTLAMRLFATLPALGLAVGVHVANAQTRWSVDPLTSLAWWQVSPNLNNLWATTCPNDPSWRPGEERSAGWHFNPWLKLPRTGFSNVDDTIDVPLFPRYEVLPDCVQAVSGEVSVADTTGWRGVHGTIDVAGDALITGESMRDDLMHKALETATHPKIQFSVDSLVNVSHEGDTVRAEAFGTLRIRGIRDSTTAAIEMFPDAGGMRVLAKWRVSAAKLFDYTPKLRSIGLGLNVWIWHYFFMGADMVFHRDTTTAPSDTVPTK